MRFVRTASFSACLLFFWSAELHAQSLAIDLGDGAGALSETSLRLILGITVLSVAPGILITITCFPFIVTVLSILRQAIGLQQAPPNMLIVSLALFLTYFVMEPVFLDAWAEGVDPYLSSELEFDDAVIRSLAPFRTFFLTRMEGDTFVALADLRPETQGATLDENAPLSLLIPGFMLSELSRAFQVGFLIFLPFLIIDLVVAAVLMSMGMMMVPPAIVSLPFKLAFFVISDGWALVSGSLVQSYF
ncbi:flagellar type III secretion system pore protein FliP [Pseudooceanicola sp. C21-150M6]